MEHPEHKRLKRLAPSFYQGRSYVHWIHTIQNRETGWLNHPHHEALRSILVHACARFHISCPVYCLMPDHAHFLFVGIQDSSDQIAANRWIRREWNQLLGDLSLQEQAYDHVLREADRERDAFAQVVGYILRNPVRKSLVDQWGEWGYSGTVFAGYPKLDPRKPNFWENYWKAYQAQVGER